MNIRPEIVLCTLGTQGDVRPFVGMVPHLRRLGHHVVVLSNANWMESFVASGAEFHSIADADPPQLARDDFGFFTNNTLPSFQASFDIIAAKATGPIKPMIAFRSNMLGAQCAADVLQLPNVRLHLQPCSVRSNYRPVWPLVLLTRGPLGTIGRVLIVPLLHALGEFRSPYRAHTDAFRRSVNADFPRRKLKALDAARPSLLLCPRWFAQPQPDWPPHVEAVGFPLHDPEPLDEEIAGFIASHGPPLVCTPGTGAGDEKHFLSKAVEAAAVVGLPIVLLSRHSSNALPKRTDVLCRDFADLAALLPKSAGLIHHGGIGTTAEALRAGVPQVIVPDRFDQPDNAMRVAELGLGGVILSRKLPGSDWGHMLTATLDSLHVRMQTSIARDAIQHQDGLRDAAERLSELAMRSDGARSQVTADEAARG